MKLHKWHNEIVAYAKGADIESIYVGKDKILYHDCLDWELDHEPHFFDDEWAFRIKPQPKEPQYLYIFVDSADWQATRTSVICNKKDFEIYIGKIKLEQDE